MSHQMVTPIPRHLGVTSKHVSCWTNFLLSFISLVVGLCCVLFFCLVRCMCKVCKFFWPKPFLT
jgi:hypothetical protein